MSAVEAVSQLSPRFMASTIVPRCLSTCLHMFGLAGWWPKASIRFQPATNRVRQCAWGARGDGEGRKRREKAEITRVAIGIWHGSRHIGPLADPSLAVTTSGVCLRFGGNEQRITGERRGDELTSWRVFRQSGNPSGNAHADCVQAVSSD